MPEYRDCPFVRFDGARLHYRIHGERGFPLLLLHGLTQTNFTWSGNVAALSRVARVVAVEYLALGDRRAGLGHGYGLNNLARGIVTVMDHLGIERADFAGNSLGGGLALGIAAQFPQRVRRLVLINPAAYPTHWPLELGILNVPLLGEMIMLLLPPVWFGRMTVAHCWSKRSEAAEPFLRHCAEILHSRVGRMAMLEATRGMMPRNVGRHVRLYHGIRAPTLIIWGGRDRLLSSRTARRLSRQLPHARLRVLSQAAHAAQEQFSDEVNRMMTDWLASAQP